MTSTTNKKFISLIDPAYKAGLLQIPFEKTTETKGRNEWARGTLRKDLSLCCLFQKGRCHAEGRCHQIHVDRVYMESLRTQQAKIISCCSKCNDTASLTPAALNFFASNFAGTAVFVSAIDKAENCNELSSDNLAYTIGLVSHMEQVATSSSTIVLPGKKVCRLHLRGACKYGKDCKNIHLCSKLGEDILATKKTSRLATSLEVKSVNASRPAQSQPPLNSTPANTSTNKWNQSKNSFLERALPKPVCETQPEVVNTPKPLPNFSLFSRNAAAPAKDLSDSLHLSAKFSCSDLDAVDVNENSGKLSGIIFDPTKALEESRKAGNGLRFDFNSMDNGLWLGATSPGQKRRGSGSSNGTTASNSLHQEWNPMAFNNGFNVQADGDFLRIFN